MTRTAYVDCVGGVAGDMLLGALIDAGADLDRVRQGLSALPLDIELGVETTSRHAIGAVRVRVAAPTPQPHRTWADVRALIDSASLPARASARAKAVFERLARAEARVHRIPVDDVHFHEVGAADAIADICGIALALEALDVDTLACSPLPMSQGLIAAAHGQIPLPAPAALELLAGAPVYGVDIDTELVTPTGAAAVATLASEFGPLPRMRVERAGYGAGSRDLDKLPNVVRVIVGETVAHGTSQVAVIETNLDDMAPELVPDAVAGCFAAGALDAWVTPVQMKKGRPGVVLSVLARPTDEHAVVEALLRETTSIGVRVSLARRLELDRDWRTVEVEGERVRVKLASRDGTRLNAKPEHDDCAAVARRTGRPVKEVWALALAAAREVS